MNVGSAVNQSLIGMHTSRAEMAQSAQKVAEASVNRESTDLAEPLVNIKVQQQVFDSSAKVLKAADENLGSLLDIKA